MAERYNEAYMLVSNEEWDQIQDQLSWLAALEAAGVDNWGGYDVAIQISDGEEPY